MNKKIIFGVMGIVIGAVLMPLTGGWLVGGVIGVMLAYIQELTARVDSLERKVAVASREEEQGVEDAQRQAPSPVPSSAPVPPSPVPPSPVIPPSPVGASPEQSLPSEGGDPASRPGMAHPLAAKPSEQYQSRRRAVAEPNVLAKAFHLLRRFFTEGNPIVRVGMVVMFFGLSFLVKYASSAGLLPVELRLAAIAAVATALMVLGWKTRGRRGGYGLVLQGGGIAALYLTVFAANKLYILMPSGLAFGLMFVIVMLGTALAILQNAQVLALMASAGGFLAPILTSDGSGNHVALFSFYLLLNLGVLAVSWFKAWRLLNWVGFVFTFVIAAAWGVMDYHPGLYASTQPFLIAFFLMYLAISILFSIRQPPKLTGLVDGSLVFGLPIVAFGLQAGLLDNSRHALALSAVVLATIYIGLAYFLWSRYRHTHRLLSQSFIALGVVFATLAVPLAMEADWTSATWAVEAAGLLWVGLKQKLKLPRAAAYVLYLAGAAFLFQDGILVTGPVPVVSGDFLGLAILAAAAFAMALVLQRNPDSRSALEANMEAMILTAGFAWWYLAGSNEVIAHVADRHVFAGLLAFLAASTFCALAGARALAWPKLQRGGYALLPLTALAVFGSIGWAFFDQYNLHPFRGWGTPALLGFAAVQYLFLFRQRQGSRVMINIWHVATAWLLLLIAYWEAAWWYDYLNWTTTSIFLLWFACLSLPLIALMAALASAWGKANWPLKGYQLAYRDVIPLPLLFFLAVWFSQACLSVGATGQLHLPFINPLDLAQLAAILVLAYVFRHNLAFTTNAEPQLRNAVLGLAGFMWLNVVMLRAIHHYTGVDYRPSALWDSATVQMALSILWSLCALVVMNLSRRLGIRKLWLLGAGLLAMVLLKLFTKDLTGTGTLARIISFMVVGALMLLIGYLSPIPAAEKQSPGGEQDGSEEESPA